MFICVVGFAPFGAWVLPVLTYIVLISSLVCILGQNGFLVGAFQVMIFGGKMSGVWDIKKSEKKVSKKLA